MAGPLAEEEELRFRGEGEELLVLAAVEVRPCCYYSPTSVCRTDLGRQD